MMSTAPLAAPMTRAETGLLAGLTLSQSVLFLVPLVVLGQAIGWPASLRLPAAEALPLIARNVVALQIGYWGYLVTALAMVAFVMALRRYAEAHGAGGLLADLMAAFGVAAAILKTLGIVRWMVAMPDLARLYTATADMTVRAAIEVSYQTLHGYAGSVGELLGVQLFSGVWLVMLGVILLRLGLRLNAAAASIIGLGFALTALRTLAPALDGIGAIMPPLALLWLPVLAATFWRRSPRSR